MSIRFIRFTVVCATVAALTALTACGGGGGNIAGSPNSAPGHPFSVTTDAGDSTTPAPAAAVQPVSLTGSIVKGPVGGAQVCVYELTATGKGKRLDCVTSNTDGSYALNLEYQGDVIVEATGGTYTDEATGLAGVPLTEPLVTLTSLGSGPNTAHATPLTALAYARAVAAGGLDLKGFQAKANLVRDAFGLTADVDLVRTLPDVLASSADQYGTALKGVSKMLGMGATLAGIVGNGDLQALKSGLNQAAQCLVKPPTPAMPQVPNTGSTAGGINWEDPTGIPGPVVFTVTLPTPAWRSLLSASGEVMGCQIGVNTSEQVVLSCPNAVLQTSVTLLADLAASDALTPSVLPSTGVLVMGHFIHVLGTVSISGTSTLNTGSQSIISVGAVYQLGAGSVSCGGSVLSASGAFVGGGVSGLLTGPPVPSQAGGSLTLSGATVSTNWRTFLVPSISAGSAGNLMLSGGSISGATISVQTTGTKFIANPVTVSSSPTP